MSQHNAPFPDLNLISLSASDLQSLLTKNKTNSVDLVQQCLHFIKMNDKQGLNLRGMISIVEEMKLFKRASILDDERRNGQIRGPLHGIPVTLKDVIDVGPSLGLPTTNGAYSMLESFPKKNSLVVEKLLDAGMIILGKASLSEFSNAKGPPQVNGLCALTGQGQSPYITGGLKKDEDHFGDTSPAGSSSGSAIAVAAGYAPIAIAVESYASIMSPASRQALYALKCSPRTLSTHGLCYTDPHTESLGGMTKTVADLYAITQLLLSTRVKNGLPQYNVTFKKSWKDYKFGFLDAKIWGLPESGYKPRSDYWSTMVREYDNVIKVIKDNGARVCHPVEVVHPFDIKYNDESALETIVGAQYRDNLNAYLESLRSSSVRSLEDIIRFDDDHPELSVGFGRDNFVQLQSDKTSKKEWQQVCDYAERKAGKESAFKIMDELELDVICSISDGMFHFISSFTGCPTATAPLGYVTDVGRPYGIMFMTRPGREDLLTEILGLYELTFPKRREPTLVKW